MRSLETMKLGSQELPSSEDAWILSYIVLLSLESTLFKLKSPGIIFLSFTTFQCLKFSIFSASYLLSRSSKFSNLIFAR